MAKNAMQKSKLIYLRKILLEETDEAHPLTLPQLVERLEGYGITAERKSLYSDLEILRSVGLDIVSQRMGRSVVYFVGEREFQLPELRLLVDAVQSSRFITHRKSTQLIKKLEELTSRPQAGELRRHVYVYDRVKADNERIYINVDALNTAITKKRKISFLYYKYNIHKEKELQNSGKPYKVSPYAMSWTNDNYYLIAYHPKYDALSHFRVDRMQEITVLDEPAQNIRAVTGRLQLNVAEYSKGIFDMFPGEQKQISIRFDASLVGAVIDRFGEEVDITPARDGKSFVASVQAGISPTFYSWVMLFGAKAEILSPPEVRAEIFRLAGEIADRYTEEKG